MGGGHLQVVDDCAELPERDARWPGSPAWQQRYRYPRARTAVDPDLQPGKNRCVALGEILHDTAFQALIVRFDEMTDWFEH